MTASAPLTITGTVLSLTTGTSGANVPLLNTANLWSPGVQTFAGGTVVGSGSIPANFQSIVGATVNGPMGVQYKNNCTGTCTAAQVQNVATNVSGTNAYFGLSDPSFVGFLPLNGGAAYVGSFMTEFAIFTQDSHNVKIYTNALLAATFDTSQNATFIGDVKAATYHVGATAGASCTVNVPAHLTVVNGIVTLCN
jgi:hypothetical protein